MPLSDDKVAVAVNRVRSLCGTIIDDAPDENDIVTLKAAVLALADAIEAIRAERPAQTIERKSAFDE